MTAITFMDIVHARLDAMAYERARKAVEASAKRKAQSLENLCAIYATRAGFAVQHFKGPSRHRELAWPRQDFMLAAHREGYSMPEIGRFLNRDHTTVLHGIRQAEAREARQ